MSAASSSSSDASSGHGKFKLASRGSSKDWGEAEGARLCQVVVESNLQLEEQVATGKTDMLDILSVADLVAPDEMGLTLPYLAVYYDRPEILSYLCKRGVDLTTPCDPMKFGTPMFYAVSMRRIKCVERLQKLMVSLTTHCDSLKQLPIDHARRIDDEEMEKYIKKAAGARQRAFALLTKNILKNQCRRWFKLIKFVLLPRIQKRMRGFLGRKRVAAIRKQREEDEEAAEAAAAEEAAKKKKKKKKKKTEEEGDKKDDEKEGEKMGGVGDEESGGGGGGGGDQDDEDD